MASSKFWYLIFHLFMAVSGNEITGQEPTITAQPQSEQSIVFNKIGQLCLNPAYLHVQIPLDIRPFLRTLYDFEDQINENIEHFFTSNYTSRVNAHIPYVTVAKNARNTLKQFINRTEEVIISLPKEAGKKSKRFLDFITGILGVSALANSIYNSQQISSINKKALQNSHAINQLVDLAKIHNQKILDLDFSVVNISVAVDEALAHGPTQYLSHLGTRLTTAQQKVDQLEQVIHAARQGILHEKALSGDALNTLVKHIQEVSNDLHYLNPIANPADLFHLETSYGYSHQEGTFYIMLHVPMITPDYTLALYKYTPTPLKHPASKNFTVLVDPDNTLLGLNDNQQAKEFSDNDVNNCRTLGQYKVCDEHEVIDNNLEESCLGSLFNKNMQRISELCYFKIYKNKEEVFKIAPNTFLVSTPKAYTVRGKCNGRNTLPIQISSLTTIKMDQGCSLKTKAKTITVQKKFHDKQELFSLSWEFDTTEAFAQLTQQNYADQIRALQATQKEVSLKIEDIQALKVPETTEFSPFTAIIVSIASTGGIIILLLVTCCCYKIRKQRPIHNDNDLRNHPTNLLRRLRKSSNSSEDIELDSQESRYAHPTIIRTSPTQIPKTEILNQREIEAQIQNHRRLYPDLNINITPANSQNNVNPTTSQSNGSFHTVTSNPYASIHNIKDIISEQNAPAPTRTQSAPYPTGHPNLYPSIIRAETIAHAPQPPENPFRPLQPL